MSEIITVVVLGSVVVFVIGACIYTEIKGGEENRKLRRDISKISSTPNPVPTPLVEARNIPDQKNNFFRNH
jgi:hypothetical protein